MASLPSPEKDALCARLGASKTGNFAICMKGEVFDRRDRRQSAWRSRMSVSFYVAVFSAHQSTAVTMSS
jgi:hypothetical protein